MSADIAESGRRHFHDVQAINRNLTEKALKMRCDAYLAQVKAQLLTQTIFEIDHSKKNLAGLNHRLQAQNLLVEAQKSALEEKNRELEEIRGQLEEKVTERTRSLEATVRQLRHEARERQQAENDKQALIDKYLQAHKMEILGRLVAGTAHEINNPLSGVLQSIQVVMSRLQLSRERNRKIAQECGLDTAALERYLQQQKIFEMNQAILDSGRRAADIVDSMLNFSRRSESAHTPHDVVDLMEKSLSLMNRDYDVRSGFDFRNIHIVRDYAAHLPIIPCTALKLQQVFINILKNGAQAIAGQQQPVLELRIWPEGEMVKISICDNGPGMSEVTLGNIFEPFFTTKDVGSGTGLGLSIAYFIITELHKGTLEVTSTPGKGSCFIISLPVAQPS